MAAPVVPLRPDHAGPLAAADTTLTAVHRHLDRCKLAPNTIKAYQAVDLRAAAAAGW